jgi:hypothetical protein
MLSTAFSHFTMAAHGISPSGLANSYSATSTPQNTPANAAPISSRAQAPGIGSIKEGGAYPFFFFLPWIIATKQNLPGFGADGDFETQRISMQQQELSSRKTRP